MFQIKICGITRETDLQACMVAGADAIGLNFYSRSARYVTPEQASQLRKGMEDNVQAVGVFVNENLPQIVNVAEQCQLNWVQLHGDETPEFIAELKAALPGVSLLRAFRVGSEGVQPINQYLQRCQENDCLPHAILLDAFSASGYGGTGERIDLAAVQQIHAAWPALPVVLAGGLKPENVAEAIQTAHPHAVDTASGVEQSPGVKDAAKIASFVTQARESFDRCNRQ